MKKRVFVLLLTACLLLPCLNGFSVTALDTLTDDSVVTPMPEVSESNNVYNKLHFYFDTEAHATIDSAAELQTATASVKSDFAAATNMAARSGESAEENVYITVQFASDYLEDETYLELKADRENAKNALERDIAKSRQNAYSKSYHQALVTENMQLLSAIPYTDFNVIDYSSFVTLTVPAALLSAQILEAVAENENILHISLTDGFDMVFESEMSGASNSNSIAALELENSEKTGWYDVLECINAKEIVLSGTYTGHGIKVGVYEYGGVCDTAQENLASRNIVKESETAPVSLHATYVTSIVAEMLPLAQIFVAQASFDYGVMHEGVSWFISKQCDVVNCSFGTSSYSGYRYDIDAVYDYQIYTNDIVVVTSSGNSDGSMEIAPINAPGYAYNMITVGGVKYSNGDDGWIHADSALYESGDVSFKPNISAPVRMHIPHCGVISEGTSYATPLVTACVAMLYQYAYKNISNYFPQHIVRAIVMASGKKSEDYQQEGTYYNADMRVGAGIIDLSAMLTTSMSFYTFSSQGAPYSEVASINVYLNAGQELVAAMAWTVNAVPLIYFDDGDSSLELPNYNVYLYAPNGSTVAMSLYGNSSAELIRYTVENTGVYRISIVQYGTVDGTSKLALAYTQRELTID